MPTVWVVAAALALGAALSHAPHARAADLLQVYRDALANDAPYAAARAALQAGQELSVQGRALLLPSANLTGSVTRNRRDDRPADYTARNYSLSLSQPVYRPVAWQSWEQSRLQVAVSDAQFELARQDLALRVAVAYFDVLAAEDVLAALQAQKVAIAEQLASAKRNFEVGTATITDTHEAQARYDLVNAQEFASINDLEIKRNALQQIVARPTADLARLRPGVILDAPLPAQIDPWVERAEQYNYTVVSQQLIDEIAQREITRSRAGHHPTLDLVASRSRSDSNSNDIFNRSDNAVTSNAVGVQWALPLFSGFAITSQVREAIALQVQSRFDLENARRIAAQAARSAFLSVNNGLAQVQALEAAEVSSQSALQSNRLGYRVGIRINIDVLNAQQQLYLTQRDLSRARYDTLVNGLRLKAAAGALGEADIIEVNALLGTP